MDPATTAVSARPREIATKATGVDPSEDADHEVVQLARWSQQVAPLDSARRDLDEHAVP